MSRWPFEAWRIEIPILVVFHQILIQNRVTFQLCFLWSSWMLQIWIKITKLRFGIADGFFSNTTEAELIRFFVSLRNSERPWRWLCQRGWGFHQRHFPHPFFWAEHPSQTQGQKPRTGVDTRLKFLFLFDLPTHWFQGGRTGRSRALPIIGAT